MVNKTLKAVVAALTLVAGGSMYGAAGRDQTISPVTCCNGNLQPEVQCNCTLTAAKGNAVGDAVAFNLTGIYATKLGAKGAIRLPEVGQIKLFEYSAKNAAIFRGLKNPIIQVLFASYSLENINSNKHMSSDMKRILTTAKLKNPWAKSLIWVGRKLPGEAVFIEVAESYSADSDLSGAEPIEYRTSADGSAEVTLPAFKNAAGEEVQSATMMFDLATVQ